MSETIYTAAQISNILSPLFDEYNVKKAVLFGSYAKGSATPKSDIDLCIDSGLRGLRFMVLVDEVCELLKKDVDMFDIRHVIHGSRVEEGINRTGVLIYEK